MPIERRAGTDIHWSRVGQGQAPALVLHPGLAHGAALAPALEPVADLVSAIAFDQPSHGKSADWDETRDIHDLVTEISLGFLSEPTHLIGHSFGGTVALRLALEAPDRVASLSLYEPVLFAAAKADADPRLEVYLDELKPIHALRASGEREKEARAFTEIMGTGDPWDSLPEKIRHAITGRIHMIAAGDPALFDDHARLLAPGRLSSLTVPILLMEGLGSPPVIAAVCDALEARLPNLTRLVLPGMGHMGPITHPAEVGQALKAFLTPLI